MPEIVKNIEELNVIKPALLKMEVGDKANVIVTDVHLDNNGLISIPSIAEFNGEKVEGHFPLNTGNLRTIQAILGTNSDNYVGASFIAVCIPRQNPNTKAEVLSWSIKKGSVKAKA